VYIKLLGCALVVRKDKEREKMLHFTSFNRFLRPAIATLGVASLTTTRLVSSTASSSPVVVDSVVIYQYESCPFCNKLRAYLDFAKLPYTVVEVDPLFKREIAWSKDYQKVPIAIIDGRRVTDSGAIISKLDTARSLSGFKSVSDGSDIEKEFLKWTDEVWVRLLTINIYRTQSESIAAFDYMTKRNFPSWSAVPAKYFGALVHAHLVQGRLKKKLGVDDERKALYEAAQKWVDAIEARGGDYLGGKEPNLADLAIFGTFRAIEQLDAAKDLVANTRIGPWAEKMKEKVGKSALQHRVFESPLLS
jgi:microsomal prostaglandin-E synthase 2